MNVLLKMLRTVFVVVVVNLAVIFACAFVEMITDMEQYKRVYRTPLLVQATVSYYEEYDDGDDENACSYVTYTVNGMTYTDVLYEEKDTVAALTPIGRTVTVSISPEDPSRTMADLAESGELALVFGAILLLGAAGLWSRLLRSRRSKNVVGVPEPSALQRDVQLTVYGRFWLAFWLLFSGLCVTFLLRYPMLFGHGTRITLGIGVAFFLMCAYRAWRDLSCLTIEDYEVRRDVLERKEKDCDSDGTTYTLHYRSGDGLWTTTVSKRRFDDAHEGDLVLSVYLRGKRRPILHYDCRGVAR